MNCKSVLREISNYLDGELDLSAKQDLERHLADCHDCQLTVDQTRFTVEVFCDEEPVELPADIRSRLHDALQRKLHHKAD